MSLVQAAEVADTAFQRLPIIDLSNLSSTDPTARRALADQVRDACINTGFFYIKEHGIAEEIINGAYEATKQFFDLPLPTKAAIDMKNTPNFKGYNGLYSATNDSKTGVPDAHEGFEFGWEALSGASEDENRKHDGAMAGANVWPPEDAAPGFREAALQYYHAAVALGKRLFPLFALALDLPEDFFADKTRYSAAIMRLLHYPPVDPSKASLGIGAHTDWECFTILWQEPGIQALEVLNANKEWILVPPIQGTFVVNLGDMLARWTNDVFKSNVHRATNAAGRERYSIPLFFGTDYNTALKTIPSCVSPGRPEKYEAITAGEYVKTRAQATYGH